MMKCIFLVIDGLGDRPIPELGNKTPLESAKTPNMDKLAREGICGIIDTISPGITPGSDTAHLALFGLDPHKYYSGRGPIEACGVGLMLKEGDIAFRANAATVDSDMNVIDRRAGRIESTVDLCKELDGTVIDGVEIILKPSAWYRAALVLRGKGLSDKVGGNDSKETGEPPKTVIPLDDSKEAKKTAKILNKLSKLAYEKFKSLELNKRREEEGKLPANMLLFRGAGKFEPIPQLKDKYGMSGACIAGGGLYKGVGAFLGMDIIDVEGATGKYDSDFSAKTTRALDLADKYDMVFIHMKATDSAGEDGDFKLKKEMIERMDSAVGKLIGFEGLIVICADHSTPCEIKRHSYEPVPLLMCGPGLRVDDVKEFGERQCAKGGLCRLRGLDIMPIISAHTGHSKLYGA